MLKQYLSGDIIVVVKRGRTNFLLFFAALLIGLDKFPGQEVTQELTDKTFEKWRDHIRPKDDDIKWQKIPWHAVFWDAVLEAQAKEMPILLWAMNGHPLACT